MSVVKIDLEEKLSLIDETWRPKVIAELNGQFVQLAKLDGTFPWHHHEAEDELFLTVSGQLRIEWRTESGEVEAVDLVPGQIAVVPRRFEHRTIAETPTSVLIFEPATTRNTGDVDDERFTAPMGQRI